VGESVGDFVGLSFKDVGSEEIVGPVLAGNVVG